MKMEMNMSMDMVKEEELEVETTTTQITQPYPNKLGQRFYKQLRFNVQITTAKPIKLVLFI